MPVFADSISLWPPMGKGANGLDAFFGPTEHMALFPNVIAVGVEGNVGGATMVYVGDKPALGHGRFKALEFF